LSVAKRKSTIPAALSPGEEAFAIAWRAIRGPAFVREYRFDEARKWRFDFAWPAAAYAVEIEGGTRGKSRHTSPTGYAEDCLKYNEAALDGWAVIRLTPEMIQPELLKRLIRQIGGKE
jgi:hypothetical protein